MTARDPMGALIDAMFDAVGAAYQVQGSLEEKIREQRRNDPELRAIRSRAALKGWGTRRAREAAERAAEEAEEKRRQASTTGKAPARGARPWTSTPSPERRPAFSRRATAGTAKTCTATTGPERTTTNDRPR